MRILFATIPEKSHLYCLIPIAWAARAAGHEVRVASCVEFVETIAQTGMTAVAVGSNDSISAAMTASREAQLWDSLNWSELDPAKLSWPAELERAQLAAFGCAMYNEPMIEDLVVFARQWQPDLVVWDPLTYCGPLVAGVVGAAHARSMCFADVWVKKRELFRKLYHEAPVEDRRDPMVDWLGSRAAGFGGVFSEEFITGQLTLDPLPERLGLVTEARRVPVRFVPYNGPAVVPQWLHAPAERARVCLSLGASNTERYGGDYVSKRSVLAALADLDVEVVAALLPAQRRDLGVVPDNVRIAESVPLHALLPSCSVLIHHGGFGSYANALVYGVPQLIITTAVADQVFRGKGLAHHGAGQWLPHDLATPQAVRDCVGQMLAEPAFRDNAAQLRAEALARPAPSEVVAELETLVAERRSAPWRA